MPVHWFDPENPQRFPRQKTIKHNGPYEGSSKTPVRATANRKAKARLERRQRVFDAEMKSVKSDKIASAYKRPGSWKK